MTAEGLTVDLDTLDEELDQGSGARYNRVLLKLSGEVFGNGRLGVDPDVVHRLAEQIAVVVREGVQVSVVVGGGNFFRGAELAQRGMDRARADYMGMLGTVMNCPRPAGLPGAGRGRLRACSRRSPWAQVAEPYIPRRAEPPHGEGSRRDLRRRSSARFRTSPPTRSAAQRALEIKADV